MYRDRRHCNYSRRLRFDDRFAGQYSMTAANGSGIPIVNIYQYEPNDKLNVLTFEGMTDDWLDFIARCRQGEIHNYDIVEGPMADDTIWNYVNDYLYGDISRHQFWELAKFRYPTHQISFHTLAALDCLSFERSENVYDRNKEG